MEPEASAAFLPQDAVVDGYGNINVAFLQINLKTFQIGFNWLPALFCHPMPEVLRKELVERLRMHADKLESGELEKEMQIYLDINEQPGPVS